MFSRLNVSHVQIPTKSQALLFMRSNFLLRLTWLFFSIHILYNNIFFGLFCTWWPLPLCVLLCSVFIYIIYIFLLFSLSDWWLLFLRKRLMMKVCVFVLFHFNGIWWWTGDFFNHRKNSDVFCFSPPKKSRNTHKIKVKSTWTWESFKA